MANVVSKRGTLTSPGSFHTVELSCDEYLQTAYEVGLGHSPNPTVLATEIPESTYQELLQQEAL